MTLLIFNNLLSILLLFLLYVDCLLSLEMACGLLQNNTPIGKLFLISGVPWWGNIQTMKTDTMEAALAPLDVFQEEWHQKWLKKKKQQETKDILIELDKREKKKQA